MSDVPSLRDFVAMVVGNKPTVNGKISVVWDKPNSKDQGRWFRVKVVNGRKEYEWFTERSDVTEDMHLEINRYRKVTEEVALMKVQTKDKQKELREMAQIARRRALRASDLAPPARANLSSDSIPSSSPMSLTSLSGHHSCSSTHASSPPPAYTPRAPFSYPALTALSALSRFASTSSSVSSTQLSDRRPSPVSSLDDISLLDNNGKSENGSPRVQNSASPYTPVLSAIEMPMTRMRTIYAFLFIDNSEDPVDFKIEWDTRGPLLLTDHMDLFVVFDMDEKSVVKTYHGLRDQWDTGEIREFTRSFFAKNENLLIAYNSDLAFPAVQEQVHRVKNAIADSISSSSLQRASSSSVRRPTDALFVDLSDDGL